MQFDDALFDEAARLETDEEQIAFARLERVNARGTILLRRGSVEVLVATRLLQSGSQASSEFATVNLVERYGVIWQDEVLWST